MDNIKHKEALKIIIFMNPYSIAPLVSALFLAALSGIPLLYGRREKVNKVFAFFALTLSLASFAPFIFYSRNTLEEAVRWSKILYVFAIPATMFALYYALVITDYIHRPEAKLWRISLRFFITFLFLYGGLLVILTVFTDTIIAGVEVIEPTGFEYIHGRLFILLAIGLLGFIITIMSMFYKAHKQAESTPERVKLLYNLIGFSCMYLPSTFLRTSVLLGFQPLGAGQSVVVSAELAHSVLV